MNANIQKIIYIGEQLAFDDDYKHYYIEIHMKNKKYVSLIKVPSEKLKILKTVNSKSYMDKILLKTKSQIMNCLNNGMNIEDIVKTELVIC